MHRSTFYCFFLCFLCPFLASAAVDFEKDVAPILQSSCVGCHGPQRGAGNVSVSTSEAMNNRSSLGQLVTPGDPTKSALFLTINLPKGAPKAMPPSGPLSKDKIEVIRQWIQEGAKWPAGYQVTRAPRPARASAAKPAGPAKPASAAKPVPPPKPVPSEPLQDDMKLVELAHELIVSKSPETTESDMKPYSDPIPASSVSMEFVPIPGGEFTMGTPESEAGRGDDEGPQHRVKVDPFWMGKYEITWDAYRLFMFATEANEKQNPDRMVDATSRPTAPYVEMSFGMGLQGYPAISMTQHAANKFAQWLSLKTGHFYRLPTEAEWEYACRAGTSTAYSFGDDPSQLGEYAWFGENSGEKYQQVGKKKPNPWGLYDMHGNVMEWTLDQHSTDFYGSKGELALNPWNKATESYPHAVRGGSWNDSADKLRCGARVPSDVDWKIQDPQLPKSIWYHTDAQWLGFRLVRPLKVPTVQEMWNYWNSGVEED
jgi:formylglycine-generating enzyme required for sulfatase activity